MKITHWNETHLYEWEPLYFHVPETQLKLLSNQELFLLHTAWRFREWARHRVAKGSDLIDFYGEFFSPCLPAHLFFLSSTLRESSPPHPRGQRACSRRLTASARRRHGAALALGWVSLGQDSGVWIGRTDSSEDNAVCTCREAGGRWNREVVTVYYMPFSGALHNVL